MECCQSLRKNPHPAAAEVSTALCLVYNYANCIIECCWCVCCLPYYLFCCCLCCKEKQFSANKPDFIKRFTKWLPDRQRATSYQQQ